MSLQSLPAINFAKIKAGDKLIVQSLPDDPQFKIQYSLSPDENRPIRVGEIITVVRVVKPYLCDYVFDIEIFSYVNSHMYEYYVEYTLNYQPSHRPIGWIWGKYLALCNYDCKCDIMRTGCICGVFQQEIESKTRTRT